MARVQTQAHISTCPRPTRTGRVLRLLTVWRSRRALAALSPEQLRDIGISRTDAAAEARRWDAPDNWRN